MTTTKTTKSQDAATAAVIEKALDSLMKSAGTAYQRSYGLFSAGLEVFKTANPDKGINDFVDTDEGAALKAAHDETRQRFYFDGPVDAYAAPAIETLQTLDAEIAKQVEAFSITHDLDPLASRARLEMISPTFADLQKRHAAADAERRASVDNARAYAKRWHDEQAMRAEQDEADRVAKAKLAKLKPSERAFEKRVGEIMKSRSLDRQKAIVWGADNDPALQSLYAVIREEKGLA